VHNKIGRIGSIEKSRLSGSPGEADPAGIAAPSKRDMILCAGAKTFMEQGFEAASMDEVARRAGVSKATIYSNFDSKHALFGAIVNTRCQAMIPTIQAETLGDQPPADALRLIGRQFLDLLLSEGPLSLYRVVLAEAPRFPALGRNFYESGPNLVAQALADYLARQHVLGSLDVPSPRVSAEQFIGMVLGQTHVRMLLAITEAAPEPPERDHIVELAVQTFLHGVARR
jgi:TetR/AcrR family transcriptional regulator, mexJK operon transcriptional repressor